MLAVIGGSGLYSLGDDFHIDELAARNTPFGDTSADISQGRWQELPLVFLPRHGPGHRVPPHRINYRANLWALQQLGVDKIIAINAVGGITEDTPPLTLVVPDQIIDYSSGREHSFFDGEDGKVTHIDFSWPYSAELRGVLTQVALQEGQPLVATGTYASTNGPRLETAAEISRLRRDGCNIVGMTGMPEAALARELGIEYACLALVVNWAAGVQQEVISMPEILANMEQGMDRIKTILRGSTRLLC